MEIDGGIGTVMNINNLEEIIGTDSHFSEQETCLKFINCLLVQLDLNQFKFEQIDEFLCKKVINHIQDGLNIVKNWRMIYDFNIINHTCDGTNFTMFIKFTRANTLVGKIECHFRDSYVNVAVTII